MTDTPRKQIVAHLDELSSNGLVDIKFYIRHPTSGMLEVAFAEAQALFSARDTATPFHFGDRLTQPQTTQPREAELEAENTRLREALAFYANPYSMDDGGRTAMNALNPTDPGDAASIRYPPTFGE